MRLALEEPTYSVGDALPNGEEVIALLPIKHGSETRGWLYCTGEEPEQRYTLKETKEMKCPTKLTT